MLAGNLVHPRKSRRRSDRRPLLRPRPRRSVRRLGGREQLADQHSAKQAGGHHSNTSSGQYILTLAKNTEYEFLKEI
jgi:hypothetical protein